MADELDGLLARVDDPALRADLRAQIDRIRAKRTFGLVFESHLPERVRLPEHPIRDGASVVLRDDTDNATYQVLRVRNGTASIREVRHADGSGRSTAEAVAAEDEDHPVGALVVIADFGEPIYPGLRRLGSVDCGGDKPPHVVVKGENHHVLEALRFTHAGKVDCIYIDPPYNTGARDWRYNNDYVDETDAWRHSKWLSMMRSRLKLAGDLLKPDSALIITIDEHEVHHLRMLLEQTFPTAFIQMVTIVVNPKGVAQGRFARVEEYAIYCFFGSAGVNATEDDFLSDSSTQRNVRFWKGLLRAGTNALPSDGLGMAYPVFVDSDRCRIASVGRTLRQRIDAGDVTGDPDDWLPGSESEAPPGTVAVWPTRNDGKLGVWQAVPETLMSLTDEGFTKCVLRADGWALSYVPSGVRAKIASGEVAIVGHDGSSGSVVLERQRDLTRAKTVWKRARHDAGWHGSVLLRKLLGARLFDFPKSLYAVRDALLPVIGNNPDALVLDFFAGSGTTAHAVALLNRSDGGRRTSISVTNNEVSAADSASLSSLGHLPGDSQWESKGIFRSVTQPRIAAAWTGKRPDGELVDLTYDDESAASDGLEENAEFMELTYLDPDDIELDLAFASIAPLLWLRAGSTGPVLDECLDSAGRRKPYAWTGQYGVLFNSDRWRGFVKNLPETATTAFVVTDSQATFAGVAAELPDHLDVVRLYENYLTTFRINAGHL
jgi:adenine-specific DNA-methyltransferase